MEPLSNQPWLYGNLTLFISSLGLCALSSFLETSITTLRLFKLKELRDTTQGRYQELLGILEHDSSRILTTFLIANNLANVIAATSGSYFIEHICANLPISVTFLFSILCISGMLLVFGEIIPKQIAKLYGEQLFASTLWITNVLYYLVYPFVSLLMRISNSIIRFLNISAQSEEAYPTSEKEVRFLIDYIDEHGLIESEKTAMLRSIFELGTTPVKEIMIPSTHIIRIEANTTVQKAYDLFTRSQLSRLPVYRDTRENIVGMIHIKDLMSALTKQPDSPIEPLMRNILFVPESIKVNQLLKNFKEQHLHLAIVINEHGSIIGLVTLEDVLEEIVGEIRDEYETVTEYIVPIKSGEWLIDARTAIDEVEQVLDISLPRGDVLTLGGFIIEQLQHIPEKGEILEYSGYIFKVHKATPKQILQVLVKTAVKKEK